MGPPRAPYGSGAPLRRFSRLGSSNEKGPSALRCVAVSGQPKGGGKRGEIGFTEEE